MTCPYCKSEKTGEIGEVVTTPQEQDERPMLMALYVCANCETMFGIVLDR